jgi:hypothetical protein
MGGAQDHHARYGAPIHREVEIFGWGGIGLDSEQKILAQEKTRQAEIKSMHGSRRLDT